MRLPVLFYLWLNDDFSAAETVEISLAQKLLKSAKSILEIVVAGNKNCKNLLSVKSRLNTSSFIKT